MSRLKPLMCALLAVASTASQAQIKAKVVAVPFVAGEGASETATGKFQALVMDELNRRTDLVEVMPAPATRALPTASGASASAGGKKGPSAEAVTAIDAGRKAFDDLRFEDAVSNLKKGIDGMLADPATADYDAVGDAYVKLAAAAFRMGEEKDAKTALLDLARFNPTFVLPPGYPPVFQREYEKAKKRLEKQPKGTVTIDGPPGSTAFLDGRDLGMVPATEENVPAGAHYVKVQGTRGERFGQTVSMTGSPVKVKGSFGNGPERTVTLPKSGVLDPGITASVDADALARLTAYAKAAQADYAIVGYVYRTSDTQLTAGTALYSSRKAGFTALSPVTFDTDVLTANTEAYKLVDEVVKRLISFGAVAALPVNLATRAPRAGTSVARSDRPTTGNTDEIEPPLPTRKPVVVPRGDETTLPKEVLVSSVPTPEPEQPKSSAAPWVALGIGIAAAVAVGTTFGVMAATRTEPWRPVSGTITATW